MASLPVIIEKENEHPIDTVVQESLLNIAKNTSNGELSIRCKQQKLEWITTNTYPSDNDILLTYNAQAKALAEVYGKGLDEERKSVLENYLAVQAKNLAIATKKELKQYFTLLYIKQEPDKIKINNSNSIDMPVAYYTKPFHDNEKIDPDANNYVIPNVSYSGCDMVVSAQIAGTGISSSSFILGELQTFTYSIYDKLNPIHSFGNVNAKDYVHSYRTIAGSMIFAVFNKHWAKKIIKEYKKQVKLSKDKKILMDEMPPLNITISMANEYGAASRLALYGIRFFNEGMAVSINDIYTENTYQFVALNIDYLEDIRTPKEAMDEELARLAEEERKRKEEEAKQQAAAQANNGGAVPEKEKDFDLDNNEIKDKNAKEAAANLYAAETAKDKDKSADKKTKPSKKKDAALQELEKNYKAELKALKKDFDEGIKDAKTLSDKKAELKEYYNEVKEEIKTLAKAEETADKTAKKNAETAMKNVEKTQKIVDEYGKLVTKYNKEFENLKNKYPASKTGLEEERKKIEEIINNEKKKVSKALEGATTEELKRKLDVDAYKAKYSEIEKEVGGKYNLVKQALK